MPNTSIKFKKKAYNSSTDNVSGMVVFDTTENKIYVGGVCYSSDVADASYSNGVLTISKRDGTSSTVSIPSTLGALTDTNISNVSGGQVLVYDSQTSKWVNSTIQGGGSSNIFICTITIDETSEPTESVEATCDRSVSDITAAINSGKSVYAKIGIVSNIVYYLIPFFGKEGDGLIFSGTLYAFNSLMSFTIVGSNNGSEDSWYVHSCTILTFYAIGAAEDVNINEPTNGQILMYNGTSEKWENANIPAELPSLTNNANKILAVNSGATGVEWVSPSSVKTCITKTIEYENYETSLDTGSFEYFSTDEYVDCITNDTNNSYFITNITADCVTETTATFDVLFNMPAQSTQTYNGDENIHYILLYNTSGSPITITMVPRPTNTTTVIGDLSAVTIANGHAVEFSIKVAYNTWIVSRSMDMSSQTVQGQNN